MKRALLAVAIVALCSATGCQSIKKNAGADQTAPYHICHPGLAEMHRPQQVGPPGPATPTVGYPYYTTRGPRDFLVDNPPSIGN